MGNRRHLRIGWLLGMLVAAAVAGVPRTVDAGLVTSDAGRQALVASVFHGGDACEVGEDGQERCEPIEATRVKARAPKVVKAEPEQPEQREPERPCPDPGRRNLEPPQRPGLPPVEPPPRGPRLPPMPGLPEPGNLGCG